jgi:hypothetical protein
MNLHEYMCCYEGKNDEKKLKYLFKQRFLIYPNLVLCKFSIVKCSHRRVN